MKKLIALIMALVLCLSMCACGSSEPSQEEPTPPPVQEVTPASLIENAQLQYPASNRTFKYNVYDTYVEITEYIGSNNVEEVIVPAILEELPVYVVDYYVFSECRIKSIIFEDGIYRINTDFSTSLESVVLPSTLDHIGSSTFDNCFRLKNVIIPEGIDSIWSNAFHGCCALKEITIPSTVSRLGDHAFASCTALETVNLPEGLKEIEDGVFMGCEMLKTLVIPSTVEALGRYVFQDSGLERIEIPENVKEIGDSLFTRCEALTVVKVHNAEMVIAPIKEYSFATLFFRCNPNLVVHGKTGSTIAKQCAEENVFFKVME